MGRIVNRVVDQGGRMNERGIKQKLVVRVQAHGGGVNENMRIKQCSADFVIAQNLAARDSVWAVMRGKLAAVFKDVREQLFGAFDGAIDKET